MVKHPRTPLYAALVGLATGLAFGTASGERAIFSYVPSVEELTPRLPDDAMPVLTHAGMALATREAQGHLDAGRPWAAWKVLRGHVKKPDDAPEQVVVLAARAAAGWDGWSHVRRLLQGRAWLDQRERGEGRYLLARADEARREWTAAADGYRRYLANRRAEHRAEAAARLGHALARAKDTKGAAEAYALAAREGGEGADWMRALEAEARVKGGDAEAARAAAAPSASGPVRLRLARAETRLWLDRGDTARALSRLAAEAPILDAAQASLEAAEIALDHARLLDASGRDAEARTHLRKVAVDPRAPGVLRVRAATRLGEMAGTRTADEELARAAAFEAGKRPGLAARALRSALRAGAPDDAAQRLRLGKLLFEERDFRPAREVLADAAARLADPAQAAEAELYAARALVRLGSNDGYAELRRLVEKRPGTAAAGSALFLLGDAAENREAAISYYRRAADVAASPDAREALYRVGDRRLKNKDPAGAAAAWEQYASRYPTGEQTAEAAYRAGVLHERAGRDERARALYGAAIAGDPVSYYAIRAADRLGADPLAAALANDRGWSPVPGDAREAKAALARLDALDRAGLADAWKQELDWQQRRLDRRPGALIALAEGLRDAGHPVEGIRLGRELLARRGGEWDGRLLRVVFPFPFRDLVLEEANRVDVDPYLLAGLVRQESSFNPRARSWVGATGLSQIMPATGQWLAPGAGVSSFDPSLLAVPEINLRMGARYLRDQLRRYGGKRDLALAAYNAGPSRADRWRRELGYGGDPDAFREKIPFDETREYVKLVLRNAVVYRRLYGGGRSPGLSAGGS
ncbi:MAG TPA: transglycosylase SLT domain-containing protein [Longimicrobium sp.]|jgi:soluble lytic murein transglycosylase|uniref:transglycosylase SLT domain-containing protein n=1 Tax=Longimicrobium sp. TaxID=2029185 RepID=UPI002ED8DA8C